VPDIPLLSWLSGCSRHAARIPCQNDEQIAFMHLDCDLYSSTKTVLDLAGDRLAPDAVLLFDEFFNYPGWQRHEFRAWNEFIAQTGRTFEYLAYTGNNEQVVVRLR
jgi:hypothetical protein